MVDQKKTPTTKKAPPSKKTLKEYAEAAAARLKKSPSGSMQAKTVKKPLSRPQGRGR